MINKLYDYYRSSCSYRVRIALNLKEIPYEKIPISLIDNDHHSKDYQKMNPQAFVPIWQDAHITLTQSIAILEYLDEQYPNNTKILPHEPLLRAKARQLALIVACDMHPLNNLRVKTYLENLSITDDEILVWYHHWLKQGFDSIEVWLENDPYCVGDHISIADICLVPQIYNALRFSFNMAPYPKIISIYEKCQQHQAFIDAEP